MSVVLLGIFSMALLGLLYVSLSSPVVFVWLYLLVTTSFFGFINFSLIEAQGLINVMFFLNVVTLSSVLLHLAAGRTISSDGGPFLYSMAAIFFFGVLYPVYLEYSSIISSITDGKDFLSFSLLGYLLVTKLGKDHIYRAVTLIGIMLSLIVIFYAVTGLHPPTYEPVNPYGGTLAGIHFTSPMYIYMALLVTLIGVVKKQRIELPAFLILSVTTLGLLLQGHRSVTLAALCVTAVVIIRRGSATLKLSSLGLLLSIFLLTGILGTIAAVEQSLVKPVHEVINQEGSVGARLSYNVFRWEAIQQRPWFGHGFIDETSSYGEAIYWLAVSRFVQTLGSIDAGYIDILARFGILGSVFLVFCYTLVIRRGLAIKDLRTVDGWIFALFLLSYFLISFTWSVFTYNHGIISGSMAIYLVLSLKRKRVYWHGNATPMANQFSRAIHKT